MNALTNVALFLVDTLFTLYIIVVLLRMLLGWARADFYNQLSQFIVTATNPVVVPLRRILPPIGKLDTSAIVLALVLMLIKVAVIQLLAGGNPSFGLMLLTAVVDLVKMVIYIYMFALIIIAVMSWVNPQGMGQHNPMYSILDSLTRPIIRPLQGMNLKVGMMDLSMLAAILLLQILLIVINSTFG